MKGSILVISGPSGSGKSSLMHEMMKRIDNTYFSISTTTREKRAGEVEGKDYFFIGKEQFKQDIENGNFLEWAHVHNNYYGTSLKPILRELKNGKLVIFDIDVQGHKIAQEKFGNIITSVFLTTPNQEILKERLIQRGTDTKETIERRLNNAISEMTRIKEYDYVLINGDFQKTLEALVCIARTSQYKVASINEEEFICSWTNESNVSSFNFNTI
ncbi:guanylate kinase [Sulfurospirillum sp. 1612]|uniref:guanylate kinase n=1 Tax=Sulfurospirillum sp. 1612 TaxID=3094835 RepID=UPI002F95F1A2